MSASAGISSVAFGYKANASAVDKAKFPQYAAVKRVPTVLYLRELRALPRGVPYLCRTSWGGERQVRFLLEEVDA
jgi:hypothetical protein